MFWVVTAILVALVAVALITVLLAGIMHLIDWIFDTNIFTDFVEEKDEHSN